MLPDGPTAVEPPDHAVTLTWRFSAADPYDIVVMGPRTYARYHPEPPGGDCLQLRFRPGRAAGLLGLPLREAADRAVPAADLVRAVAGSRTVPESHTERLRLLAGALTGVPGGRLVGQAMDLLSAGEPVHRVARRLDVSERHLRTLFIGGAGLTPSQFVRIRRVRTVLAGIGGRLPDVSADAGYFDQSHMTAEFRRVMGVTPGAFARRRWPAAESCQTGSG
jgi:AraC-like DNA-binding protein